MWRERCAEWKLRGAARCRSPVAVTPGPAQARETEWTCCPSPGQEQSQHARSQPGAPCQRPRHQHLEQSPWVGRACPLGADTALEAGGAAPTWCEEPAAGPFTCS